MKSEDDEMSSEKNEMNEEVDLIEQLTEVLAGVDPAVAIRAIDYLTITHRAELKALRDAPKRMPDPEGQTAEKPSFLLTQRRIEAAEVLREVERIQQERAKDES